MQSIEPIIRALLPRDFTQADIDEAVRKARANAIQEAIEKLKTLTQGNDTGAAFETGYNFAITDAVEELEQLKKEEAGLD